MRHHPYDRRPYSPLSKAEHTKVCRWLMRRVEICKTGRSRDARQLIALKICSMLTALERHPVKLEFMDKSVIGKRRIMET